MAVTAAGNVSSASAEVPLSPRLLVPLPATAQRSTDHKPTGTRIMRGEALLTTTAGAAHVPLAPAAGTIRNTIEVQLLDGTLANAIEIEVDLSDPMRHTAASATPQAAENLTDLIDRVRLAGIWANGHTSPDLLAQLHEAIRRPV